MKKLFLTILFVFYCFFSVLSQEDSSITIKGKIIECDTYDPIPYANIFVKNSSTGVIADSLGKFEIEINDKYKNDTLFISLIGYTRYGELIGNINLKKEFIVELDDSLFLLSEAIALAYDNFKVLLWNSKKGPGTKLLLTCATKDLLNVANFIKILKSEYGMPKTNANILKWKNVRIKEIKGKKLKVTLTYCICKYCPGDKDLNITIGVRDKKNRNVLERRTEEEILEKYFQAFLDQTFAQGIDYSFLEKRDKIAYLKNDDTPYSGKCFGYHTTGERGLKGTYLDGKKIGHWVYWYSNAQKKLEVDYIKGKKHGVWYYWYKNGNMRIKALYSMGKLDGHNMWWYENGNIKKESYFNKGIFYGSIEYDKNGNVSERKGEKIKSKL